MLIELKTYKEHFLLLPYFDKRTANVIFCSKFTSKKQKIFKEKFEA